ncbi:MAG: hypothetical protein IKO39_02930 [Treponema sp.]|nr:hypothetical protein [Treponema sp.]
MVKHIKKIALLLSAGAMLVFASCSGLANGSVSGNDSPSNGELSIYLGGDGTYARFLAPDTLTTAGIAKYEITGESVYYGYTLEKKTYTADSTPNKTELEGGTVKLEKVQLDDWNFTLWAYDSSDNLVLKGTSLCQMKTASETSVTFNLSSYEIDTLGSYEITIKYTGSNWVDNTYSFEWALYNPITGACLTTVGAADGTPTTVAKTTADPIATDTGVKVSATGVTPGTYLFGVTIKNGTPELAFASDILLIEPGRQTKKDFAIGDIIDSIPTAPTGFKVQRILGSEDSDGDFYDVRLIWTDASTNEKEFKLCLKEFENTTSPWESYAANADLSADTTITVYSAGTILEQLSGDIRYVAGSLYAGSTELVLRLPTGRLFDFQILAVNDIGSSASVLRETDNTGSAEAAGQKLSQSGTSLASTTTTIVADLKDKYVKGYEVNSTSPYSPYYHVNLVRTVYALNGGTYKESSGSGYSGKALIEYSIYKLNTGTDVTSADITDKDDTACAGIYLPLKTIKTLASGDYPSLVKGTTNPTDFTSWHTTIANADKETVWNVNAYKNIVVEAVYGVTTGDVTVGTIKIEALPAEDADRILAYYGTDNTGATNSTNAKNATITVARGAAAQYVTVKIGPKTSGTEFAKWQLYINGSLYKEITAVEASTIPFPTFSTSKLKAGGNEIMVVGVTANGGKASSKFVITIGN